MLWKTCRRGRGEAVPGSPTCWGLDAGAGFVHPEPPSTSNKFCPGSHPHASVLAPVRFKGLNPYPTEVSSKPPREQSRVKAKVGERSAAQRSAALPTRAGTRVPKRWAGGGRVRAMRGRATLGGGTRRRELSAQAAVSYRNHTSQGRARSTEEDKRPPCRRREPRHGSPGPRWGGGGGLGRAAGARSCPPQASLQTVFIDFPARRAISVTSAQEFAPPIILRANLSG